MSRAIALCGTLQPTENIS